MMCLAALVWIISCATDVTGSSPPKQVKGEIGGNATFDCFPGKKANATFFFFQTNNTFVNGYYEDEVIKTKWNNTVLDGRTVHMYELKPSHTGVYECIMQYKDGPVLKEHFYLSVTGSSPPKQVKGEIGGNATFNCFPEEKANATFFYFQTNTAFVNGYYEDEVIKTKWNNTVLDGRTVHMYELKPSHTGVYECIMQYKDGPVLKEHIYLSVTAKFSEPTVV